MARRRADGPTDAELEILHVLWQRGPCTVRNVYESLNRIRKTGYTTALKLLQLMAEKGLATRDESKRSHVYKASISQEEVRQQTVGTLLDRLFDGSPEKMVVHALRAKQVPPEELNRIRELLDQCEGED